MEQKPSFDLNSCPESRRSERLSASGVNENELQLSHLESFGLIRKYILKVFPFSYSNLLKHQW